MTRQFLLVLATTWSAPASARPVALAVQAVALLGTLVGVFTIAIGIGPRTVPDIAYHAAMVAFLVWGLFVVARSPAAVMKRRTAV